MSVEVLREQVRNASVFLSAEEAAFKTWRGAHTAVARADKTNLELENWIERLSKARHVYMKAHRELVAALRDE